MGAPNHVRSRGTTKLYSLSAKGLKCHRGTRLWFTKDRAVSDLIPQVSLVTFFFLKKVWSCSLTQTHKHFYSCLCSSGWTQSTSLKPQIPRRTPCMCRFSTNWNPFLWPFIPRIPSPWTKLRFLIEAATQEFNKISPPIVSNYMIYQRKITLIKTQQKDKTHTLPSSNFQGKDY